MTPRYEWTPASEPPDTFRGVLVYGKGGFISWWIYVPGSEKEWNALVTHWRDVSPPDVEAPK